jgi:hypothetical protein
LGEKKQPICLIAHLKYEPVKTSPASLFEMMGPIHSNLCGQLPPPLRLSESNGGQAAAIDCSMKAGKSRLEAAPP